MAIDRRTETRGAGTRRPGSAPLRGGVETAVRRLLALGLLALWPAFGGTACAQEVLTQDEALKLAFPDATAIERRTAYLGEQELAEAQALAGRGVEVRQGVVSYYVARRGTRPLGVAYFDVHRVRTLPEVVMIVVTPRATVARIEILKFSEPPEYRAPEGWLDLFHGKPLTGAVSTKRGIPNITGATLTADAVTDAVRRVLALHRVIQPLETSAAP